MGKKPLLRAASFVRCRLLACCHLTACLDALQDMSKDAVGMMRAAQEKAAQLAALAAAQPNRPPAPAENQGGGPSLVAAAQAAANALAQKVPYLCVLPLVDDCGACPHAM